MNSNSSRLLMASAMLLSLFIALAGCGNDTSPSTPVDNIPPAAVGDLAVTAQTDTAVVLTWSAPGDDGTSGRATSYDIRYATTRIDEGRWRAATIVEGEAPPREAGQPERMVVPGLHSDRTRFFALKTLDEATRIANPPAPAEPGREQSFYLSGLEPATSYFVALRSTDQAGNISDLSNVVQTQTSEPSRGWWNGFATLVPD
jgi:hypothetical protein